MIRFTNFKKDQNIFRMTPKTLLIFMYTILSILRLMYKSLSFGGSGDYGQNVILGFQYKQKRYANS